MHALCGFFFRYLRWSHFLFHLRHLRAHGFVLQGGQNASLGCKNLLSRFATAKGVEERGVTGVNSTSVYINVFIFVHLSAIEFGTCGDLTARGLTCAPLIAALLQVPVYVLISVAMRFLLLGRVFP